MTNNGVSRFEISIKFLTDMWRKKRKPVEADERVVKDSTRSRERTMNRAVKLLAAKPRSVLKLHELLEKLWTNEEIVDAVLEKLKKYKYLDDQQYARDLAVSKLRQKPQGKRRLNRRSPRKPGQGNCRSGDHLRL